MIHLGIAMCKTEAEFDMQMAELFGRMQETQDPVRKSQLAYEMCVLKVNHVTRWESMWQALGGNPRRDGINHVGEMIAKNLADAYRP